MQAFFTDGSSTEKASIDYPVGHRRRREEGIPLLEDKFERAVTGHFSARKVSRIIAACSDPESLEKLSVPEFTDMLTL